MSTAIITSDTSIHHLTGDGHPERPERVIAITEKLKKRNDLIWDKPKKFDLNNILPKYEEVYNKLINNYE